MPGDDGRRASDDDREAVVGRLRDAAGRGVLTLDELEERLGVALSARTHGELARVTADLPAPVDEDAGRDRTAPRALDSAALRAHLTAYVLTMVLLVGIWVMAGGGHFWPFYPAASWGIGLGLHAQSAHHRARRRSRAGEEAEQRARDRAAPGSWKDVSREIGRDVAGLAREAARDVGRDTVDAARRAAEQARTERRDRRHGPRPGAPAPPPVPSAPGPSPLVPGLTSDAGADGVAGPTTRFVVACFFDVARSTQLTEALGDERWAAVRSAFRTTVAKAAGDAGGWEANTAGDGVLVRFDHPAAAARAAVAVLRDLRRQRGETGFAPAVRIGIHSGDAVDEGVDIIGAVVNLAARVCGVAGEDEILVTEHVADHLGDGLHTRDRGLHTLKGVSRPRHLLAVDWD